MSDCCSHDDYQNVRTPRRTRRAGLVENLIPSPMHSQPPGDKTPTVKCPQCGKRGPWLSLPTFPFCSSRCKQLDLYKWFSGEHVIPSPLRGELFEDGEFAEPNESDH